MTQAQLTLYSPRRSQRSLLESKARFKVANCGRRFGKTLTGQNWLLKGAWEEQGENWWVAPVYRQARIPWRRLIRALPRGAIRDHSKQELRVELISGGVIQFFSAENYDALRGEGIKKLVLDEAALIAREAWEEVLRPALSDTAGEALFLSTPKGRNWFFELYSRGQDRKAWPQYESWTFPTSDNPKIPRDDIEEARRTLPADVFLQEYLAVFLEGHAGVFRKIDQCIGGVLSGPVLGESYWMGVDLAKHQDFTVISILDPLGRLVYWDRFNQIDWTLQKGRIIDQARRYGASVLIDSTGVGDPILDDLVKAGLNVHGYKFTYESKKDLVESLVVAMENREITIPRIPVLINELRTFEYQMGKSGQLKYSAPSGFHDDCVISLALSVWAKKVEKVVWSAPYAVGSVEQSPDQGLAGFAVVSPSMRKGHWEQ